MRRDPYRVLINDCDVANVQGTGDCLANSMGQPLLEILGGRRRVDWVAEIAGQKSVACFHRHPLSFVFACRPADPRDQPWWCQRLLDDPGPLAVAPPGRRAV